MTITNDDNDADNNNDNNTNNDICDNDSAGKEHN